MSAELFPMCMYRKGDSIVAESQAKVDELKADGWTERPEAPARPGQLPSPAPERPHVDPSPEQPIAPAPPPARPKKKVD